MNTFPVRGTIFIRQNAYKQEGSKQPDFKGTVQIPISMLNAIEDHQISEFKGEQFVSFDIAIWSDDSKDYIQGSVTVPRPKDPAQAAKKDSPIQRVDNVLRQQPVEPAPRVVPQVKRPLPF